MASAASRSNCILLNLDLFRNMWHTDVSWFLKSILVCSRGNNTATSECKLDMQYSVCGHHDTSSHASNRLHSNMPPQLQSGGRTLQAGNQGRGLLTSMMRARRSCMEVASVAAAAWGSLVPFTSELPMPMPFFSAAIRDFRLDMLPSLPAPTTPSQWFELHTATNCCCKGLQCCL